MNSPFATDDDLARRLPLPLAQLYRRAHNAKTPLERYLTAYYLWEAGLKLLASVAIVEYADRPEHDPQLAESLRNLARPSLGHWWEFVRRLVPVLADQGDEPFQKVRDLVLGRTRDDLPRTAGLDAALREALDGQAGSRTTVRLTELFDRLVRYRNQELGHGAAGQRPAAFYEKMGAALLAGAAEVLGKLDVLAGRRLLYVAEVRQVQGEWLVQRYELTGETARRIESLTLPRTDAARLPDGERVYLEAAGALRPLHPLLLYDAEADEALFLNARRGKRRTEYLSYTTGRTTDRPDLGGEQRTLLARVLGMEVGEGQAEQWAAQSHAEEPTAEEPAALARRTLGEFELLSELGRGGMGVVYRAWQPSLGRQVALKKLLHAGDPRTEARFRREIRALGRVEHPHLVRVFTSGAEGDQWFYAMELVEGATLSAVWDRLQGRSRAEVDLRTWQEALSTACEEARKAEKVLTPNPAGPSPSHPPVAPCPPPRVPLVAGRDYVRRVGELMRQAALAAHALHEAGVVHRDIKPGNILVTADAGQAILMDLGLAQLADDVEGRLTRTRQFVGTLRYASPEQVLAAGLLDRRTDVYSLGATLWELLTLRPLFGATDQTPTPELMQRIQFTEPERPSRHHAGLPADLEAVVLKCLEKDPQRRYATAHELAEELQRFLAGEPVQARPVGRLERTWRWCRRNPVVAGLGTAVAAALLAGTIVALYFAVDARAQANEAKSAWKEAEKRELGEKAARERAEQEEKKVLANAYFNHVALAQREWLASNVARTEQLLALCPPELRHWEWHYLRRLCHGYLRSVEHTAPATCVAFDPAGKLLACANADGIVRVVSAATGRELWSTRGHSAAVTRVAVSPDGRLLASAGFDKRVQVWDIATGKNVGTLEGHTAPVWGLAFSPDGTHLASAGEDKAVRLWDPTWGKEVRELKGHVGAVYGVAFSRDGLLATAGADRTIRLWRLPKEGAEELQALRGSADTIRSIAFSPNGKRLASASDDRMVTYWDLGELKPTSVFQGHAQRIEHVAFSPDGEHLASASADRTVKIWVAGTESEVCTLRGHTGGVLGVAYSSDGKLLATAGDASIKLWDATGNPEALTLPGPESNVHGIAFSPNNRRVASACSDGSVRIWEAATGREIKTFAKHVARVTGVAYSPDGKRLASTSFDQSVRVWDAVSGEDAFILTGHTDGVASAAFSPDGKVLASASGDQTVKLWNGNTGEVLRTLRGHTAAVTRVVFSPDGKRLATASYDHTIRIWDPETGEAVSTLRGHTDWVHSVAFGTDGHRVASASSDHTVKVWDCVAAKELCTLRGHTDGVWGVAFSPDGLRLASASLDKTLKIWNVASEQEILTLRGHNSGIHCIVFSPDGHRLASVGADGTVKVWDATPEDDQPGLDRSARSYRPEMPDPFPVSLNEREKLIKEMRAKLAKPVSLPRGIDPSTPLRDALQLLIDVRGLDILVDHQAFADQVIWIVNEQRIRGVLDRPVGIQRVNNVSLGTVLWLLLSHVDGTHLVRPDALFVTTAQKAMIERGILLDGPHDNLSITDLLALSSAGRESQLQSLREKMAKSVHLPKGIDPNTPLQDVLEFFSELWDIQFLIDTQAFARNKVEEIHQMPVKHARVLDTPLDKVLRQVLAEADATYHLLPDAVLVVPQPRRGVVETAEAEPWLVHLDRAYKHARANRSGDALAEYNKALKLNPNDASIWIARGSAYFGWGELDKALADFSRAITLSPERWPILIHRAEVYEKLKQVENGMADYSRAIELAPQVATPWTLRGRFQERLESWDKAIADYSKSIELDPKPSVVWADRGRVYVTLRQWEKALADYSKCIELMPEVGDYWLDRGHVYFSLRQWDKALTDFSEAIALFGPDVTNPYFERNDDRSWKAERRAFFSRCLSNRGYVHAVLGQWLQAVDDYSLALEFHSNDAYVWLRRGNAYRALRRWNRALADHSRAIELASRDWATWAERGDTCLRAGRWEQAVADYSKAIELGTKDWDIWLRRGDAYAELSQWDRAAADYNKAAELKPEDDRTGIVQALMCLRVGDEADYRKACAGLLARFRDTDDPAAANGVAWTCVILPDAVADRMASVRLAEKAVAKEPKNSNLLNTLGAALYRAGQFEEAVQRLQEAITAQGKEGTAWDWLFLALANHRLGKGEDAKRWLDKATSWIAEATRARREGAADVEPLSWSGRLELELLRREAENLIRPGNP